MTQGSDTPSSSVVLPVRATRLPDAQLIDRWRALGLWSDKTLPEAMAQSASTYGDTRLTCISAERPAEITLAQFHDLAGRVASGLSAVGIGAGDVVAVQTPNWLEGMVTFAAAHRLGAVVLPIIHIYGAAELGFILAESGAKLLVSPAMIKGVERTATIAAAITAAGLDNAWYVIGGAPRSRYGPKPWTDLVADRPVERDALPHPDDIALLIYTSGTTANPKGVQHSHRSLLAQRLSGKIERPILGAGLCPWPVGHVAGFSYYMELVIAGRKIVFLDQWDGEVAARAVAQYKLSASSGTPLHIRSLLDLAAAEGLDVSCLSDYMAGGTIIPANLVERCEVAGIGVYRGYGSSEHPVSISGKACDPLVKRLTTEGRPVIGVNIRLIGDDGFDVPEGDAGEIALRGPQQFLGYRDARLNDASFTTDGWFLTGDIARCDTDGYYAITDRKKDIIIRAGENISSREVEDHVLAHPAVAEAAAIAEPHFRTGERVCVFVVLKPDANLNLEDLQIWFAERGVARQKTPERVQIIEELPKNSAGKVVKQELRNRFLSE